MKIIIMFQSQIKMKNFYKNILNIPICDDVFVSLSYAEFMKRFWDLLDFLKFGTYLWRVLPDIILEKMNSKKSTAVKNL